jgi:hypothetical protein
MSPDHSKSISGNGNDRPVSVFVEDDPQPQPTGAFFDSSNPVFAPPKQIDTEKKKGKKGKLVALCFTITLILGGVGGLYLLLRITRVNVKVQADTRRDGQGNARPKPDSKPSESGLTAEAINLTRQELGTDAASTPATSPSAGASPSVSPAPSTRPASRPNYSATENSPVFEHIGENYPKSDTTSSSQSPIAGTLQAKAANETVPKEIWQPRANTTQTIFVDDPLPRSIPAMTATNKAQPLLRDEKKTGAMEKPKIAAAVLPPFGTMLPVRTQGVLFTLRNNSYARLELSREMAGAGWSLPKGTVLIGRLSGSEYDRAFVNVIGYLDSRDNKLIKMTGEVLGSDGAAGIQGKRVVVDRGSLKRTFRKVASGGMQAAGMMAGALAGRGTVVIDGAGYRLMNPMTDEAGRVVSGRENDKKAFVKVEAGRPGYVMVSDLPKNHQAIDAPGEEEVAHAPVSLSDREVMQLVLFGTQEEIRAAVPLMTDEQKRLTLNTLAPENEKR